MGERQVVVIFLEIPISERCLLSTGLYFARSFTVSKKFPWLLNSKASRCHRKGRFCLLRNNITSTTFSETAFHFFALHHYVSECSCQLFVAIVVSLQALSIFLCILCGFRNSHAQISVNLNAKNY